jgi:hypothetical protein
MGVMMAKKFNDRRTVFQFKKAIRTQCQPEGCQFSIQEVLISKLALTECLVLDIIGSIAAVCVQVHTQSSTSLLFLGQEL